MAPAREPIGIILAGGRGRRIGGSKAVVELCGRPLICYPLEAMKAALSEVRIVAKADTELPSLPGVTVWVEPEHPRHPLVGIVQALGLAEGRSVVVCALDLPFVTAGLLSVLARAPPGDAPAVVASSEGAIQPLLGCYQARAGPLLAPEARRGVLPMRELVAAIGPRLLEVGDPLMLFNINAPDDLLQAAAMLDRKRLRATP
jgi:molybdopterin-guanine dinucleotide biosynthesis protein A